MTKARKPLVQFAQEYTPRGGYRAWVETIPEYQECAAARANGVPIATIRQWLVTECGYDEAIVTDAKLAKLSRTAKPAGKRAGA